MFHTFGLSTKSTKSYNSNESSNKITVKAFQLDKSDALVEARDLLEGLKQISNINDIISIYDLYNYLNLVDEKDYYPVISNNILSLSCCFSQHSDINDEGHKFFDIILNSTLENIGNIYFNYSINSGFTYSGNVGYNIKKIFKIMDMLLWP